MIVFFVFAFALLNVCTAIRRDEQWPPKELVAKLRPLRETCEAETGVTDEAIKEFSDGEIHFDPKLKCYMKCLFHEFEMMDSEGNFHFDKMLDTLPEEMRDVGVRMLKNCREPLGADLCEKSFELHKCWKMADPEHYFLV